MFQLTSNIRCVSSALKHYTVGVWHPVQRSNLHPHNNVFLCVTTKLLALEVHVQINHQCLDEDMLDQTFLHKGTLHLTHDKNIK